MCIAGEHGESDESGHSALPYDMYMLCRYLHFNRKKKLGFQYEMGSKKVTVHPLQVLSISVTIGDDLLLSVEEDLFLSSCAYETHLF